MHIPNYASKIGSMRDENLYCILILNLDPPLLLTCRIIGFTRVPHFLFVTGARRWFVWLH